MVCRQFFTPNFDVSRFDKLIVRYFHTCMGAPEWFLWLRGKNPEKKEESKISFMFLLSIGGNRKLQQIQMVYRHCFAMQSCLGDKFFDKNDVRKCAPASPYLLWIRKAAFKANTYKGARTGMYILWWFVSFWNLSFVLVPLCDLFVLRNLIDQQPWH